MGKIRSSKAEFWTDPKMGNLPREVRFTFKGIWEVMADDEGRFLADPRLIKGQVWPLDDDITVKKVRNYLRTLTEDRRIVLYSVDGASFGHIPSWSKHQKISHPTASKLPAPPSLSDSNFRNGAGNGPTKNGNVPDHFRPDKDRDLDRDVDRSGAEAIPEAGGGLAPDPDPLDRAAPPAPLVVLPPDAQRLLDSLYDPHMVGTKKRTDAARQLFDTIDPARPKGARLDRGTFVRARDVAHLEACCRAVTDDPPRNRELAVRFVLLKLQDPPPGPSVTEQAADRDRRLADLEDTYAREAKRAGMAWVKAHPDEYAALLRPIEAQFAAAAGSLTGRLARESVLTQQTAKAAGFPSFDEWCRTRGAPLQGVGA